MTNLRMRMFADGPAQSLVGQVPVAACVLEKLEEVQLSSVTLGKAVAMALSSHRSW